ncbi:MAG: hypothetical protein GY821_16380 [Gammaproteobacteria bacterium]|nr:hypothetical protein [Gammaproteobacteria bacterium]
MLELKCSFITHNGNNRKPADLANKFVGDLQQPQPDIIFVSEQEGCRDESNSLSKQLINLTKKEYECCEFLAFDTMTKFRPSGRGGAENDCIG